MSEVLISEELKNNAALIRICYLGKPIGKANVALAEIHLKEGIVFCAGATSRGGKKSPIDIPKPKSAGGQFEPTIDSRTGRMMDTDAEYKVLSAIAHTIEISYNLKVEGKLYLYTEFQPCESCNNILSQFKEKFTRIEVIVFWDYPYPPIL